MPKMPSDESTPLVVREDERPKPKLPFKQLSVLVICRLSEPICLTSILSYLPQMVRSFGVPETDVGFWVGLTASSFSIAQCMTGVAWGRLSDRVGRKPAILCGILGMLSSVLVFGFSNSIAMAMISRSCIGFLNGNVGILRTVVAELVPERELQPQAFSLLPLTWSIGSIAGPIIGGFLSEPAKNYPSIFPQGSFFDRHPFALPNIFTAAILFMALVFGTLFLEETLVGHRHRYDPGREVGKKIEAFLSSIFTWFVSTEPACKHSPIPEDEETAPLASQSNNYSSTTKSSSPAAHHTHHPHAPLPWSQVLTRQSIYNIVLYFLIAIHVVSYDSILPVFFSTKPPNAKDPIRLPFHIPGGFGLSTAQIGLIYSVNAIITMLLQFLLYPPIARHYGSVKLLAVSAAVYPFIYFVTPYTLPIASQKWLYASWSVIILLKSITGVFAFTSSTILITNTASSIRVLGTLNGFATSTAAMGRAVGPSSFGWMFSLGQRSRGWTTIPWVGLTIVALMMWVWIPKLVEGDGVDGESSSESSESSDDEGEEENGAEVIYGERARGIEFVETEREEGRLEEELEGECKKVKGRRRRLSMGSVGEQ
ncbi:hypothetical protein EYR41_001880 [Orbilia oligospora]|uniref:Uncharacterized protein n=1 Tax=Orbilia oligospora TaxID=2813651 RepID=A0A7C8PL44_ORBOL|nr:hypothetical protein TWF751_006909 [Orbilia oligospora]TGJ74923.1 hypothetical protein EYR41_001880 [Orbilia oligospora]